MKTVVNFPTLLPGLMLTLMLMLSGCSFPTSQVPADHFYRLPPVPAVTPVKQTFAQILVRPVQVEGLFHERAMLYVEQDAPLEIHRYRYHYWVEPPAVMVGRYITQWLQKSAVAGEVSGSPVYQRAELEISALITGFERLVTATGYENQLAVVFTVSYADSNRPAWSKQYQVSVPSASAAMHDTAAGFGQGLEQILEMLLADLLQK